ncbi:MAG: aminopeptidase N [Alphaproteobacteria bacterium]|nr:aminopeptidase N [Alphaproteobacteria bacterium]
MSPKTVYSEDYKKPDFQIKNVDISFELDSENTRVVTKMDVYKNIACKKKAKMWLDGDEVELISIKVNGKELSKDEYVLNEEGISLLKPFDKFELLIETKINPKANTKLQGLYESNGVLCTKCETHGFRRITFYPDRPDVMPTWRTTLIADKNKYPKLVSNGNKESFEELENGKIRAVFYDPIPKASYLFAVVAGDLDEVNDSFTTVLGKNVQINVFVEKGKGNLCGYAIDSLKRAMRWDEKTFGRIYDHDVFNIVAVSNFNSGACENTSLNIFNDKYILSSPLLATDSDYENIESVVAHEYFHNWSGNRVTLRQWFDLTLKEGLTVYRDQEFSSDVRSRAVKRIDDVFELRAGQFVQDSGPLAHPIRPSSYISVRSLYTSTVYNKGAEVIRMMERMVGKERFRKGMDLYFSKNDGKAVSCKDFVDAISEGAEIDLEQFYKTWYLQAGTPNVVVKTKYYEKKKKYILELTQNNLPSPGQKHKKPFVIPLEIGLLDNNGNDVLSKVIVLYKNKQKFVFENILNNPVLSINRGFTAPVNIVRSLSNFEKVLLMKKDKDLFNRWDAAQGFSMDILLDLVASIKNNKKLEIPFEYVETLKEFLKQEDLDKSFVAKAMKLPSIKAICEKLDVIDVNAVEEARSYFKKIIANELKDEFLSVYQNNKTDGEYEPNVIDNGKRALKNVALSYLSVLSLDLAKKQYFDCKIMNDKLAAFMMFVNEETNEAQEIIDDFYKEYKGHSLVVDKWMSILALNGANALNRVKKLLAHECFDIKNPNKVRALINSFGANMEALHKEDGSGYDFIVEQTLAVDKINPQVAAIIPQCLGKWKKFNEKHQDLMRNALNKILETKGLSPNTFEVVSKILN